MHCIKGFIGKDDIIRSFQSNWIEANTVALNQGHSLILLTNALFEDINELVHSKLEIEYSKYFKYFSPSIYLILGLESRKGKIAYFEIDYLDGVGSQSAVLFDKGVVKIQPCKTEACWDYETCSFIDRPDGYKAINTILKELGVYKEKGKDEFDSVGLVTTGESIVYKIITHLLVTLFFTNIDCSNYLLIALQN